jgi:UDP-glucose 4-epimerase
VITGGAGFIGSHLAAALLAREDGVTTVTNTAVLAELVHGADAVFHLAAAAGARHIAESPFRTIETNLKGTETVLAKGTETVLAARARGCRGMIPRERAGRRPPFGEPDDADPQAELPGVARSTRLGD